ncbi:MAG TPA: D-isomer specific 2-hydroxyacid dehydrogenase family protein, partial [Acidimicrobiales bacterium]|nr:D-isomer specific 2-hydroxyacid dehydrogenase family protein [Acidimicrobiales bacterium]
MVGMASDAARILVLPAGGRPWLADAVRAGGGEPVTDGPAGAVVWTDPKDAAGLRRLLDERPDIDWVQLPWAGIEPYVEVLDHDRRWTCGKGVYADPVAEQALMLALAGLRGMGTYARATTWEGPIGHNLLGARVVVVGGGGISESLVRLLQPFRCEIVVVRRTEQPFPGATRTVTLDRLDDELPAADLVVLAVALTPETEGLFDGRRLRKLASHAWLVNVARGRHVVTDDLVEVLQEGAIGGAGLDVVDPEPLPDGHPLWTLPNCFITPHVGNTPEMAVPLLSARVQENVRRYLAGEELLGPVDVDAGY